MQRVRVCSLAGIDVLMLAAFFSAMTLGQALLGASALLSRARHRHVYWPLGFFFAALSVSVFSALVDAPVFEAAPAYLRHWIAAASFPSDMAYLPLFWFYVRALTSERSQGWRRGDLVHFAPSIIGFVIFCAVLITPETDRTALFDTGRDKASTLQAVLFVLIVGLYVGWLCQWLFYALAILRRLVAYRRRLKDLFATTAHLELGWISWLGALILVDWMWVAGVFIVEAFTDLTPFEEPWLSMLDLALVWTISAWGLRQAPGLLLEVEAAAGKATGQTEKTGQTEQAGPRYEKSALSAGQIDRLKAKIEAAMEKDRLYKNPDLSLNILAKHIGARPNYVSQTLNAGLGATFFDYVNQKRIRHAQGRLLEGSDTVLAIALEAGFNTRSSFYAAFKRYVGATPGAWREAQREIKTS